MNIPITHLILILFITGVIGSDIYKNRNKEGDWHASIIAYLIITLLILIGDMK